MNGTQIWASIKRGFGQLLNFGGRDTRGEFWSFALLILGLYYLVTWAVSIPLMVDAAMGSFRAVQQGVDNPDGMPQAEAAMAASIADASVSVFYVTTIVGILATLLLLAAVTRRLHDRGFSGWWAFPALVTQVGGIVNGYLQLDAMRAMMGNLNDPSAMQAMADGQLGNTLAGVALLIANLAIYVFLLIQLVQEGEAGDNRYGPGARPADWPE
jgi:uncharacterized membrane protein YhaH (DUF805 family)